MKLNRQKNDLELYHPDVVRIFQKYSTEEHRQKKVVTCVLNTKKEKEYNYKTITMSLTSDDIV